MFFIISSIVGDDGNNFEELILKKVVSSMCLKSEKREKVHYIECEVYWKAPLEFMATNNASNKTMVAYSK